MYGERIRELRKERNMSQKQLGEAIGVDFRTVSFWETERYEPSISQIIKLCKLFQVESDYLLGLIN
ncbi:MAG TPA: hypothetical protein DIC18_01030 [Clostridiales bacterium]|nr:hypothetical protein [Clostridiales bacterium]